jgi:Beta-propeller repeat
MRTSIARLSAVMVAASLLSTLGVTGASAASPDLAKAGSAGPSRAAASPGAQLWSAIYGSAETESFVYSVAVSPDGGTVFVTGSSNVGNPSSSYVTIACL